MRKLLTIGLMAVAGCSNDMTEPVRPEQPATPVFAIGVSKTWTTLPPMLLPRSEFKAAYLNGVIYTVGGITYGAATGYKVRARVEAYNISTKSWTIKRSLPSPRIPIGVSAINGKLYVAGGDSLESVGSFYSTRTLYIYNPATDSWIRGANLPARADHGAQAVINGQLYVYAGNDYYVTSNGVSYFTPHAFYRYNPTTNTWTTLKSPPFYHKDGSAAAMNGRFYLAGGRLPNYKQSQDIHLYNPSTGGWSKKTAHPSGLPARAAYAAINNRFYIATGEYGDHDGERVLASGMRAYDRLSNTWVDLSLCCSGYEKIPTGRYGAAGVAAGGIFYMMGGDVGWDLYQDHDLLSKVEAYTP